MMTRSQTEALKGMSIFLVMIGHLITTKKLSLPMELRYLATFSVDAFLIVSGYGLTKSYEINGLNGFFLKRAAGVFYPFIVATISIYIIYGSDKYTISELISTITFNNFNLSMDTTMWFVYYIVLWYFIFFSIFFVKINKECKILTLFALSFLIHANAFKLPYDVIGGQFSLHAFSFPIGVFLASYSFVEKTKSKWTIIILAFLFLLSYSSIISKMTGRGYAITCTIYSCFIFYLFSLFNIKIKLLNFVGKYAYEAYLVEGILLRFNYSKNQILNAFLFLSLSLVCAILLRKSCDKLLFNIKELAGFTRQL